MPCLANINTLAGLDEPCEVCAETLPKMREMMGWVPFRGFYMSNKLAAFQHDALLDRIEAARGITAVQAGLPGSFGSSKADERTNTEHNGAQEHNDGDMPLRDVGGDNERNN